MAPTFELPTLSLANIGSPEGLAEAAQVFKLAAEKTGFLQIVNHGIDQKLIEKAFGMAEAFFKLPANEKIALRRNPQTNKGYEVLGSQVLEGSLGLTSTHEGAHLVDQAKLAARIADQKEGLMMGFDTQPGDKNYGRYAHGENILPAEESVRGLKSTVEEYLSKTFDIQKTLMKLVAVSLELDPKTSFVNDVVEDAIVFVRFLHYPPSYEKDVTGIGSHSDFGWVTLLATSGPPGLELYYEGEWLSLEPEAGSFIVNIGDCLSTMTNNKYKSSLHRVINKSGVARYSIPTFLEGNPDFVVRPLGTDPASTEKFQTVEEVLRSRFDTTYEPEHL